MARPFSSPLRAIPPLLLCALHLVAQETGVPRLRLYTGLTFGTQHTQVEVPADGSTTSLQRSTLSILGGFEYGATWGGELGIHFLGSYPAGSTTDAFGTTEWTREVNGMSLAGTARLPLGRRVALVGRAGVLFWSTQARSSGDGWITVTDGRDSGRSGGTPLLGAGLQVDLTRNWVLRLDGETLVRVLDARMTRWSGGFVYRF
jgi:opacity protein-like surface antigen